MMSSVSLSVSLFSFGCHELENEIGGQPLQLVTCHGLAV